MASGSRSLLPRLKRRCRLVPATRRPRRSVRREDHHDPVRVASLRIALYGVWPCGRAIVPQASKGIGSTLGNVIWFVIAGWWLTILHIATGVVLCLTIIGIPLGMANFKLITVGLRPFGREIVSVEEARRRGVRAAVVPTPTG
jgi:uncharacterized membrane protein YccF (DUF307 family)